MPPPWKKAVKSTPANVPGEWLRDARGDLALANVPKTPAIRYAHLCFHAQQAGVKLFTHWRPLQGSR